MDVDAPKFRRRKEARPAEIAAAAMSLFVEKGFAGTRLDEVAARAGVSKGALYLYFETKEDLFHAAVAEAVLPNLEPMFALVAAHPGPFDQLVETLVQRLAHLASTTAVGGLLRVVIGEARNFPEIARHWHDQVAGKAFDALGAAIAAAQARGEVGPGNPRFLAMSIIGPLVMAVIWRETFVPVGGAALDIPALAEQHLRTVMHGLAESPRP